VVRKSDREAEYITLIAQTGFKGIITTRSEPWTAEDGTQVYSLNVKAVKGSPGRGVEGAGDGAGLADV